MINHYTHEGRFKHYKYMLYQIWKEVFGKTPISSRRLIMDTRNSPHLTKGLARQSPYIAGPTPKQSIWAPVCKNDRDEPEHEANEKKKRCARHQNQKLNVRNQ